MRSSTLAFLAVLAFIGVAAAFVHGGKLHHHNHASVATHGTPPTHVPARPQHREQKQDSSYSAIMAYHEEPTRPPRPLYEAQYDIEDFHSSGGFDTEIQGVINNALIYAQSLAVTSTSMWVFDIDETSLSGYAEMLSLGLGGYVPKLNHEWILNASAPAIPQTLQLYQQLVSQGFTINFLTGRRWDESDATETNLRNVGYTTYHEVQVRTPAEANMTATVFKSGRRTKMVEEEGWNIVGCVGDQWSDLHGPYTGFKVKIPNYIYFLP